MLAVEFWKAVAKLRLCDCLHIIPFILSTEWWIYSLFCFEASWHSVTVASVEFLSA